MDEEMNEGDINFDDRDMERKRVSSLDRQSRNSRDFSLNKRYSLLDVMDIEHNEENGDIFEYYIFNDQRISNRNSHRSRQSVNDNHMENQENGRGLRRSSQNKAIGHECSCFDSIRCLEYHCVCSDNPNEYCLPLFCCQNCIEMKKSTMINSLPMKTLGCTCKFNKCLNSLCKCYNGDTKCNPQFCKCRGCLNSKDKIKKKPQKNKPNKHKNSSKLQQISCSCKKSQCLKKYCCCYNASRECGPNCECIECQNHLEEGQSMQEKIQDRLRYAKVEDDDDEDIDKYLEDNGYDEMEMPNSMQFDHPDMKNSFRH